MSKYATEQKFGGQRASVGRAIVLATRKHDGKEGTCLRAGTIRAVSSSQDLPYIVVDGEPGDLVNKDDLGWKFVETRTESEVEAMPFGSWTWPPRI